MFKHTSFEDSPIMRSLTKVAHEKGWVTPTAPLVKQSAPIQDLTPTEDLMANVLKLTQGLRTVGFDKQAQELENHFVAYKKAQTLYGISNEKGEDLVDSAHPKGSHKLRDVDSTEATIETILDRHLQFVEVVNSKPTGKLASSRDIIQAVKMVLAQDASVNDNKIYSNLNYIFKIVNQVEQMVQKEVTLSIEFQQLTDLIKLTATNPTEDNLNEIISQLNNLKFHTKPHNWATLGFGGVTDDTWAQVEPLIDLAIRYTNHALQLRKNENINLGKSNVQQYPNPDAAAPTSTPELQVGEVTITSDPVISKGSQLVNALNAYKSVANVAKNPRALNWITQQIAEIEDVLQRYNKAEDTGQLAQVQEALTQEIQTKTNEVQDFYQKVVNLTK
jgi:hypothetical protein